jgi:NADH-quinone oxidoreductase subunit L
MTIPLMVLAGLSLVGGLINTPWRLGLEHFLEPAFEQWEIHLTHAPEASTQTVLAIVSALVGVAGILGAAYLYLWRDRSPTEEGAGWRLLGDAYRVDDLYGKVFVEGGGRAAGFAAFTVDQKGVDGAVNGVAALTRRVGERLRPIQSGLVRNYALAVLVGAVALLAWFLVRGGL